MFRRVFFILVYCFLFSLFCCFFFCFSLSLASFELFIFVFLFFLSFLLLLLFSLFCCFFCFYLASFELFIRVFLFFSLFSVASFFSLFSVAPFVFIWRVLNFLFPSFFFLPLFCCFFFFLSFWRVLKTPNGKEEEGERVRERSDEGDLGDKGVRASAPRHECHGHSPGVLASCPSLREFGSPFIVSRSVVKSFPLSTLSMARRFTIRALPGLPKVATPLCIAAHRVEETAAGGGDEPRGSWREG